MKFCIRFRVLLCAALAAGGLVETGSGTPPPAAMRTGPSGYVKWWPGELPVVLSAGHNGMQRPDTIRDRTYGTVTIVDSVSAKLAHAIRDAMRARFGQAPHLVICELSRRKVDCNREIVEGAQGNAAAARVWREYHGFIQQASQAVLATSPHGLYFDIHSHGHPKPRLEIGCLVPSSALRLPDERLDGDPKIAARSSIREAARRSPAGFAELLRGPTSMGGLLEARGLAAIPSPRHRPEPKERTGKCYHARTDPIQGRVPSTPQ